MMSKYNSSTGILESPFTTEILISLRLIANTSSRVAYKHYFTARSAVVDSVIAGIQPPTGDNVLISSDKEDRAGAPPRRPPAGVHATPPTAAI
ncbi:hypothetical protein J6590_069065 [Homalodisca vitripennis]|nr:hypothetical protein J6590_069065 [Homalodisca vitripennis]